MPVLTGIPHDPEDGDSPMHQPNDAQPQKVDRRVQRTRQQLHRALMELILEKRYDKITVQDIIDRADVGRSTFYAHFLDKNDLFEQGLQLLGQDMHDHAADAHDEDHVVHSLSFFRHGQENRDMYRAMFDGGGGDFLLELGRRHIVADIEEHLAQQGSSDRGGIGGTPPNVVAQFMAGAMMSVLTWWLREDRPVPPEEINEMYQKLAMSGLQSLR